MCDEQTEKENRDYLLSRRDFNKITAAASVAAIVPGCTTSDTEISDGDTVTKERIAKRTVLDVTETDVDVKMQDGVSDCYFVHPSTGAHAGVLMWPDIKGLRPAYKKMGKRLAEAGYSVLVVNPFYRDLKHPVVGPDAQFSDPDTRAFLFGMAKKLTQDNAMSDAVDYINFIDQQNSVDTTRKIGTMGYCMGGPLIMRTAAAVPDRVGAAASYHGGGMVTDKDDSPHLLIERSPAQVLHAIAENDDKKNPQMKAVLAETYKAAGVSAEIEVYEDTMHGWCALDSAIYHEGQAERAWFRTLLLFERALA